MFSSSRHHQFSARLVILLVCLSLYGFCKASYNFFYSPVDSYTIPIVAWRLIPSEYTRNNQTLKDIKDCGFNTFFYYDNHADADPICRLASDEGLHIILGSPKLKTKQASKYISELSNTDNILCWYLQDEPHFDDLPKLKIEYDNLKEAIIDSNQDKPIYINLIGALSKKYTGECKTMSEYLDTIENLFHPDIWSYDYYPVSISNGKVKVDYNQFFTSLNVFKDQSQKTGKPFWAFCQSMEFKNNKVERPAATLSYLRFEAFSALAFGAKGIVYWGYNLPKSSSEQYISALTDSLGRKTKSWFYAQEVNREIIAYNNIFNHSQVSQVHIYQNGLLSAQIGEIFDESIKTISDIQTNANGILISDFSSDNENYMIIINLDIDQDQDITARLDNSKTFFKLETKKNGSIRSKKIKKNMLSHRLSPGSYLIISYNDKRVKKL